MDGCDDLFNTQQDTYKSGHVDGRVLIENDKAVMGGRCLLRYFEFKINLFQFLHIEKCNGLAI